MHLLSRMALTVSFSVATLAVSHAQDAERNAAPNNGVVSGFSAHFNAVPYNYRDDIPETATSARNKSFIDGRQQSGATVRAPIGILPPP